MFEINDYGTNGYVGLPAHLYPVDTATLDAVFIFGEAPAREESTTD